MRKALFVAAALGLGQALAWGQGQGQGPVPEVRSLFVPGGFDDNDEIVVVADGYLPDPCHELREPKVHVDLLSKSIVIEPTLQAVRGVCPDVIVPFTQVVRVGNLPEGVYSVGAGGNPEILRVKKAATAGKDDYWYAPVDTAHVLSGPDGKLRALVRGRLTNTCLSVRELRLQKQGRVFELLPILEIKENTPSGKACEGRESPFERTIELPEMPAGRYLLHVRGLNGTSVNEVFSKE